MLPPESNPERRQVKVNSRHRLHHAAELPALGQAGNMVFCAYVSPAGQVFSKSMKTNRTGNHISMLQKAPICGGAAGPGAGQQHGVLRLCVARR